MQLPSWFLSGILTLLLGLYVANYFRGQEYGADQPQHPDTGEFMTVDEDFWRWAIGGLAVTVITVHIAPSLTPAINNLLQSTSTLAKAVIGLWGYIFLKATFKSLR